jgi:predicted CXXCH cytochrome family protein
MKSNPLYMAISFFATLAIAIFSSMILKKFWLLTITLTSVFLAISLGIWLFTSRSVLESSKTKTSEINSNDFHSSPPGFVGKETCAKCHESEFNAWRGSDHDKAMAHANDSTVLGKFQGDSLISAGITSRFFRKNEKFIVQTEGKDGIIADFEVKFTFGVNPLQQYLVEFPGGRLQCLPLAWDIRKKQWFHLHQDEKISPDDWLHWTKDGQNWNGMCSDCHSTGLQRNFQPKDGSFKTTWKEINVSCEACHGPGAEHVKQASSGQISKWISGYGKKNNYGLINHFPDSMTRMGGIAQFLNGNDKTKLSKTNTPEIEACAPCHARRSALKPEYGFQKNFMNEYVPELLRENVYHADGQIQDENFEYGSFLQSKMFQKGVGCSDCHNPHTLKVKGVDNALCTRCHEAARFDAITHHQHQSGSKGSLCVNCHMPTTTYMVIDARRDHSLRIPRPDLSQTYGTPNACNNCHSDKPASWAADWVIKWHGPHRKQNFADLLALGRSGKPGAEASLKSLAEDNSHPAIARATAISLLVNYLNEATRNTILKGSKDPEPLIRHAAAVAIEDLAEVDRISGLSSLLQDSILAIRIAAAHALTSISPLLPDSIRSAYNNAAVEGRRFLAASAYFPSGRFNLGQLFEKKGINDSAVLEYQAALALDIRFIPARINLAQLLDRMGKKSEASYQFKESIRLNPEFGDAHYFLGLLLAAEGKLDSSAYHLEMAIQKSPTNSRIPYNLALVLQKLGQLPKAIKTIQAALAWIGEDPDYLYTLAWLQSLASQWQASGESLVRLGAVAPQYSGLSDLLQEVKQKNLMNPKPKRSQGKPKGSP